MTGWLTARAEDDTDPAQGTALTADAHRDSRTG